MKVKTSVTLSPELIIAIDRECGGSGARSAFIESAAWERIRARERRERDERDIRIYAEKAAAYNLETAETLAHQAAWA